MLYVSRTIMGGGIGIADTDDGTETIVNTADLERIVNLGIVISGVETMRTRSGMLSVVSVNINRGPSWVEAQQERMMSVQKVKSKMLQGVNIAVTNGVITGIDWDARVRPGTRVVLSNYAVQCADNILPRGKSVIRNGHLVLVLDDNIGISANTFTYAFNCSDIVLDITYVTNPAIVRMIYEYWYKVSEYYITANEFRNFDSGKKYLIDSPERWEMWEALFSVRMGMVRPGHKFSQNVMTAVGSFYYNEFKQFVECRLMLKPGTFREFYFRDDVPGWMKVNRDIWLSGTPISYNWLKSHVGLDIFKHMNKHLHCDVRVGAEFSTYMRLGEPIESIKELYIYLCRRVAQWILSGCP